MILINYFIYLIADKRDRFSRLNNDPRFLRTDPAGLVTTIFTTQEGSTSYSQWNVNGLATLSQSRMAIWCWSKGLAIALKLLWFK
jgi:hypothetical protein